MAIGVQQFLRRVVKSGLLSEEVVREYWRSLPREDRPSAAKDLARKFVAAGKLTKYQAAAILAGKLRQLVLGNYVILGRLGAGGMGQVFIARHRVMQRLVALKTVADAKVESKEAIERFRREVRVAARLEHPNIVTAYDADEANGVHFLTMQYVDGEDLSSHVKKGGPLPVPKAVNYVCQAAKGLGYAHEHGVIHRDIKPGNLLLDKSGTVKVLDMGLARLIEESSGMGSQESRSLTVTGQIMGTADFIAPEQAQNTLNADACSDIYSLGCTLYWLLMGRPPYECRTLMEALLAHQTAEIPSLVDARPDVNEDFDAVLQKMLAKDPAQRQQSMREVVEDLQAAIGIRDSAVTSAPSYDPELESFLKSHSLQTAVAPSVSHAEEPSVTASRDISETIVSTVEKRPHVGRRKAPSRPGYLVAAAVVLIVAGTLAFLSRNGRDRMPSEDRPAPAARSAEVMQISNRKILLPRTGMVASLALSRDGRWLVASEGSVLRLWNLNSNSGGPPWLGHYGPITDVDFAPDSQTVATVSEDGTIRVWSVTTGAEVASPRVNQGNLNCVTYSPDGQRLAAGAEDGTVLLWEVLGTLDPDSLPADTQPIRAVAFSSDGKLVASGGASRIIRLWDVATHQQLGTLRGHTQEVHSLAFVNGDRRLISAAGGPQFGEILLWDVAGESRIEPAIERQTTIRAVDVSDDGEVVAIAAGEGSWGEVTLADVNGWQETVVLRGHPFSPMDIAFAPEMESLAASFEDGSVKIWNVDSGAEQATLMGNCEVTYCLAFSPDGGTLVTAGLGGVVKLWDRHSGTEALTLLRAHERDVQSLAFSRGGEHLASGDRNGRVVVWNLATQSVDATLSLDSNLAAMTVAFAPDAEHLVVGGGQDQSGELGVWDLNTRTFTRRLSGHRDLVACATYSPDGSRLASGGFDNTVCLWNEDQDTPVQVFEEHLNWVSTIKFSPDGKRLASGSRDRSIVLRDLDSGRSQKLVGHAGPVRDLFFIEDGRTLLSAGDSGVIRIWDVDSGVELQQLDLRLVSGVFSFALSEDQRAAAIALQDGSIQLLSLSSVER